MHPALTADEYLALRVSVDWPAMTPDVAAAALDSSLAVATARDDEGRLIGLARAVGDGFYAIVVDVIVAPDEQENGVAANLLESLLADPAISRAGHVALFAAPDATELYASFGFRAEGGIYMQR